jgi:hypothetical protein
MATLVAAVALWPLVHLGAVTRFRIDPWEGFGWAMYALPAARVQIGIETVRTGEPPQPLRAMGEDRRRIQAFARRRTALGALASVEPLAYEVLASAPEVDTVRIKTREIRLDPVSATLVARDQIHEVQRPR